MQHLKRTQRRLGEHQPQRWLLAVILSGIIGVAFGHIVKDSVSGSVSVVDGISMVPTFQSGARVYSAPISSPLLRGDIVLLDDAQKEYAIKRIVGMPGETVQLWRGHVFIDGKMLREHYLPKNVLTVPDDWSTTWTFKLNGEQYFVLGDNRFDSVDSRAYGPVNRGQIKSRVPMPRDVLRADFAPYGLPPRGTRMIEAL
jgi:signal peptidase I